MKTQRKILFQIIFLFAAFCSNEIFAFYTHNNHIYSIEQTSKATSDNSSVTNADATEDDHFNPDIESFLSSKQTDIQEVIYSFSLIFQSSFSIWQPPKLS